MKIKITGYHEFNFYKYLIASKAINPLRFKRVTGGEIK